jgi:oxygen-dependent protoporphyrinogen oxidase
MAGLIAALRERLTGDCRLGVAVAALARRFDGRYCLTLHDGSTLEADAVLLALPAYVAARLVAPLAPEAASRLEQIRYVSTGTVSLAFRRDEVSHPLNGFGLVIPRSEGRRINAVTWTSTKFDRRAPDGHVLIRVFFGGSRRPEMMALGDDTLLDAVRSELRELLDITAQPLFHRIYRWFQGNPQYDVNHLELVGHIESALPAGLFVAGSPYRGIGLPDCIRQAKEKASLILHNLAPFAPAT